MIEAELARISYNIQVIRTAVILIAVFVVIIWFAVMIKK
jgi:hypothetical protein